jgi:pyruvate formate lyase activating enzyme
LEEEEHDGRIRIGTVREGHLATQRVEGTCFDIQRFAIHDGPGIRTTVFLKGCPLTCSWCHNPEGRALDPEIRLFPDRCIACGTCHDICPGGGPSETRCIRCGACAENCPADARRRIGRTWSAPELVAEIERDRPFFEESGGGVTFSGGEPLAQPEFLLACLAGCRECAIHTAVDTSGYAAAELIREVAGVTDLFLYDLKILDPDEHLRRAGVPLAPITENLRLLDELGAAIWIRIPILPGINDGEAAVDAFGRFVAGLPRSRKIHLLPYHRMGIDKAGRSGTGSPAETLEPPTRERLEAIKQQLTAHGLQVKIGG